MAHLLLEPDNRDVMDEIPKGYTRIKSAGGTCNRCLKAIQAGDVALWHPQDGLLHPTPCEPPKDALQAPEGFVRLKAGDGIVCGRCLKNLLPGELCWWHPTKGARHMHPCQREDL